MFDSELSPKWYLEFWFKKAERKGSGFSEWCYKKIDLGGGLRAGFLLEPWAESRLPGLGEPPRAHPSSPTL